MCYAFSYGVLRHYALQRRVCHVSLRVCSSHSSYEYGLPLLLSVQSLESSGYSIDYLERHLWAGQLLSAMMLSPCLSHILVEIVSFLLQLRNPQSPLLAPLCSILFTVGSYQPMHGRQAVHVIGVTVCCCAV